MSSKEGRSKKKVAQVSDETLLVNLTKYAENHGGMFSEGGRVVPITVSGLKLASRRREELTVAAKKSKPRLFGRESAEEKELKKILTLFEIFRVCPRLRIRPGTLAPDDDVLDLDDFISLTAIEFIGCTLTRINNPPLGLREILVSQATVSTKSLSECIEHLTIDDSPPESLQDVSSLSKTLTRLSVKKCVAPPLTLEHVLGPETWPNLKVLKLKGNKVELLPCIRRLPVVTDMLLVGNGLRTVQYLEQCTRLTRLDLTGNEIVSIENALEALPPCLTHLNLSRNRLTTLGDLWRLHRLAVLDVSDNHLTCWREVRNLLSNNVGLRALALEDNAMLEKKVPFARPFVAGMMELDRWKDFRLEDVPLVGGSDDVTKSQVKAAFQKYKHLLESEDDDDANAAMVITESPKPARSMQITTINPASSPDVSDTIPEPFAFDPTIEADEQLLSGDFGGDALNSTVSSRRGTKKSGKKSGRKMRTVRRLVPKKKQGDKADDAAVDPASESHTDNGADKAYLSSSGTPSGRESSRRLDTDSTADEAGAKRQSRSINIANSYSSPKDAGFLATVAAKSLSDSAVDDPGNILADVKEAEVRLSDPSILNVTTQSWRDFVSDVSTRLSVLLNSGTIQPMAAKVGLRHKWGSVKTCVGDTMQNSVRVALFPPTTTNRTETCRRVAVDAASTDGHVLFIRIRSGDPNAHFDTGEEDFATQNFFSDHANSPSAAPFSHNACPFTQPDRHGFTTRHTDIFEGFGVPDATPHPPVELLNVVTWEVGEAKPWDIKKITVEPTPGAQYVSTFDGITYLQRMQQAELRGHIHNVSKFTLLAGFEVPNQESEDIVVDMLRQRLKACAVSPQWPVSTNLAKNSQSAADSQTFAFNHPAFKEELDSAELISPSDLRAGCKTRLVSETDLFMYFGSSIAGCRKPDEDISKYDIRIGYHIVPCDGRPETSGNEQLVDSCYTNALLGSTGAEQDEKSCWVAVSNTRTYFCLDLNTDRFSKAKQPFLFLSCHLNGDLSKIEIGYGMQYMRLVYGGETGSTYLLVPRCLKTTRRLLKLLTTAPNAAKDARLTVHSSPFMSRQLFQGQGAVLGYFLVFMRQDQLVTLRKDRDISYMAFPQDVYPLRELGAPMLPVSLIITKDDILVLSDRFGAWPDNEHDPSRWHIEKKLSLGDISQVCIAPAMSAVHPNRFAIDFEDEDADEEAADSGIRWNFVAQTPAAVTDVVSLVKREWEMKWRMALGIAELTSADEQPVTKKKK